MLLLYNLQLMERSPQDEPYNKRLALFAGISVVAKAIKQTFKESATTITAELQVRRENALRAKIRREQHRNLGAMAKSAKEATHQSPPQAPIDRHSSQSLAEADGIEFGPDGLAEPPFVFVNIEIVSAAVVNAGEQRMKRYIDKEMVWPDGPSDGDTTPLG
jgi:hypothetical protein